MREAKQKQLKLFSVILDPLEFHSRIGFVREFRPLAAGEVRELFDRRRLDEINIAMVLRTPGVLLGVRI
jgi:hypothetical protein